jgi:hypothetical protein
VRRGRKDIDVLKRSSSTPGSQVQGNAPREVHVLSPEVFLRRERIVGPAPELEIIERRGPAERMRMTMVDLQSERFAAPFAAVVPISTSLAAALEDRAPHGRRDVTRAASLRRGIGCTCGDSLRRGIGSTVGNLRRCRRADLGRGSLASAQLLYECMQRTDLDLRQRGSRGFVTKQVLRFFPAGHLGLRIDLGDQPQELSLAPEPRASQDLRVALTAEM